jgi:hypothetical protein
VLDKVIKIIEGQNISVGSWLAGFTGVVFIRYILEVFSSPTIAGNIPSDAPTLVQYGLCFLAILIGLICITGYFTKKSTAAAKLGLYAFTVIWLGPVLDLIISFGKGSTMTYIFDKPARLLANFFQFFGPQVTLGLRIELLLIILLISWYVWRVRGSYKIAVLAGLVSYTYLFCIFAIPSFIYALSGSQVDISRFLYDLIARSNISHNTIDPTLLFSSNLRFFELGFDKLLSHISFIIAVAGTLVWSWQTNRKKLVSVFRNCRPERVLFYLSFLGLGVGCALLINL